MENRETLTRKLAELILDREALKFGDFTLASGKKSDYYIDGRIVSLLPEGTYLTGEIILAILEEEYPEAGAVGGLIAGAVPVATAVARASRGKDREINAFMVRKEVKKHGTQRSVEGPLEPGTKVVVVDDVVTSGGSTVQAIDRLEEFGCSVLGTISIVDREEPKVDRYMQYRNIAILTISTLREIHSGRNIS